MVQSQLANSLTSATSPTLNVPGNLLNVGRTLDKNLVPETLVEQYINWADSQINAVLSEMYVTPFNEIGDFETELYADISAYNDYVITSSYASLNVGDTIILIEGSVQERHIIESIIAENIFSTVSAIAYPFTTAARVIRVKYPDPIQLISARLAAANVYEKFFAAQSSPNESEFGKFMRRLARQDLNSILQGRIKLHGAHAIGNRFVNSNIKSRYHLPESAGDGSINIEDVG